jgi:plastocyanin
MTNWSPISLTLAAAIMVLGLILISSPSLATQTDAAGAKTVTILIQGLAFTPANLSIEKGTTVDWMNWDRVVYMIKSDKFASKELYRGDVFSYTFNDAGTYDYAEASNPSMKGRITVT